MSKEDTKRLALVRDLLAMTLPLINIISQLSSMGWDYEGDGVLLTKEHLVNVLQRYMCGEVSEADIELWANYVEGRDDVQIMLDSNSTIEDILFELANPLLTQQLDIVRAKQLMSDLA